MNQTKKDLLTPEKAIEFIEQMRYPEKCSVEDFDVLFDFLREECLAYEEVFFALVELANNWDVLMNRFGTLYTFFQNKSQFLAYLDYFWEKNHEYTDEEFIHHDIMEQIKHWNQFQSAPSSDESLNG